MAHKLCLNCGFKNAEDSQHCISCGTSLEGISASDDEPSVEQGTNSFRRCNLCNCIMIRSVEQVVDPATNALQFHEFANCKRCGSKIDISSSGGNQPPAKKKMGPLAIVGFILSFICPIAFIGMILGIIDLATDGKKKRKHGLAIAAIPIGTVMFLIALVSCGGSGNKQDLSVATTNENSEVSEVIDESTYGDNEDTDSSDSSILASDYENLKIGDIVEDGNFYLGLAHIKRASKLTTAAFDYTEDVASDHEVIIGFFEVKNVGNSVDSYYGDFSCYVDGVQVNSVESTYLMKEDGVSEFNSYALDPGEVAIYPVNFDVPQNWSEIKIYSGSNCIWSFSQDDITTDAYTHDCIFENDLQHEETALGSTLYDDDYQLTFDNCELYSSEVGFETENFVVFEFTVTNTGDSELDYSLAGYEMRGYCNDHLLDGATYILDDKIGDYINIYDVDSIQSGMSAKIYIAFETDETSGNFGMSFDDGYILNNTLAEVFVTK